jgi:hypothetical protein
VTRVVSSGTTSNGDVVFYDDTEWPLSGESAIGGFGEIQAPAPPPSNATPATPPPQASGPEVAIDNDQASLTMTVFFPLTGVFPPRDGGGTLAVRSLARSGFSPAISARAARRWPRDSSFRSTRTKRSSASSATPMAATPRRILPSPT